MPLSPPRICRCGAVVRGRCPRCQALLDAARGSATARGYDVYWRSVRAGFLRVHPHCSAPDCAARATEVDHVDGNPRNHDWANLRPFCHHHHSSRTARDQSGWSRCRP